MTEFGFLSNLVAIAGCLAAATTAIALAWMKRVKWQPPEEVLPKIGSRFSGLVAMVVVALIYVFGKRIGLEMLAVVNLILLLVAIVALSVTITTNVKYSFYYPKGREEKNRLLGGGILTEEAREIAMNKHQSEQEMLEDVRGARDKIWTRSSMAVVNLRSTISFVFLVAFGTSALAAAAMLLAVYSSTTVP